MPPGLRDIPDETVNALVGDFHFFSYGDNFFYVIQKIEGPRVWFSQESRLRQHQLVHEWCVAVVSAIFTLICSLASVVAALGRPIVHQQYERRGSRNQLQSTQFHDLHAL